MKQYYRIKSLIKFSEEDVWGDGCQPQTARQWQVDIEFTGQTPDEVIKKVADYVGCEVIGQNSGVERNACGDKGRVDFAVTENADGTTLSNREWALFKQGQIKAWYCIYTGYVELVKVQAVKL